MPHTSDAINAYCVLSKRFSRIAMLKEIEAVLAWDNAVIMPPLGSKNRASQMALIATLHNESYYAKDNQELFEKAQDAYPKDSKHYYNLMLMEKEWRVETALPSKLVEEIASLTITTERKWRNLSIDATSASDEANDLLASFTLLFDKVYESAEIKAEVLGISTYDAMLDSFEHGTRTDDLLAFIRPLTEKLPSLIDEHLGKSQGSGFSLPIALQKKLCRELAQSVGFYYQGGRLDESAHPFSSGYQGDQRITVHYKPEEPLHAVFALLHECGHALYEKNLPTKWQQMPIGRARGMSLHESQSLFIENHIGKSNDYIAYITDTINRIAPGTLANNNTILQHCRVVKPNYIRIASDELTYPAHIMIRSRIEQGLFSRKIRPQDIEELWNQQLQQYLKLKPVSQLKKSWMQDIHWFDGLFGYFPHYLVGAIAAAQLFDALRKDTSEGLQNLKKGDTLAVQNWLQTQVHSHGSSLTTNDIVQRASKRPLSIEPFVDHLKERFSH